MPELNVSCQQDSANGDIYAALHAFARSLNSEHLSFMADPPGAMIISRLAAGREVGRELHVRELTSSSHFSPIAVLRRLDQLEKTG